MKKETRPNGKKERAIMMISSAFVLTALTITGVALKNENTKTKNDGYTVDLAAMEQAKPKNTGTLPATPAQIQEEIEDDLDYMPLEVGGSSIILPEITKKEPVKKEIFTQPEESPVTEEVVEAEEVFTDTTPHFPGEGQLLRPVPGELILPYSMNKGIYFTTLDQYKYNPANIYSAQVGEVAAVCCDGVVEDISYDPVTGYTLLLDLGDGYRAVYGQLDELNYVVGDLALKGTALGTVASPTKYFSEEGSNLYFELDYNADPVDPAPYLMP